MPCYAAWAEEASFPHCVALPAQRGRIWSHATPATLPLGARLARPSRAHPTSWASDFVSSDSSSSSKRPGISSKTLASSFLDSDKALLKNNEELLAENSSLREKLRQALQVQQGEVPKTKSSFGGRGEDSIEESIQEAVELSSDAQALASVNESQLRDVIEKSNEAAQDALSAAQVAVWTEAIALIGCIAGICSSWISWKMDDDELPPELQVQGKGSVPDDLLVPPPDSRIVTIPRQRGTGDARAQNEATRSAVPPMPKQTFASWGSAQAAASSKAPASIPAAGEPAAVLSPAFVAAGAKAGAPASATTAQAASSAQESKASTQVPASTALGAGAATATPAGAAAGSKATASVPANTASTTLVASSVSENAVGTTAQAASSAQGSKASTQVPASTSLRAGTGTARPTVAATTPLASSVLENAAATTAQAASPAQESKESTQVPASTALGAGTATATQAGAAAGSKATASVPANAASTALAASSVSESAAAQATASVPAGPASAAEAAAPIAETKAATSVPATIVDEARKAQKTDATSDVEAATTASASETTRAQAATPAPKSEAVGTISSHAAASSATSASASSSASTRQATAGSAVAFPKSPPQPPSATPQIPSFREALSPTEGEEAKTEDQTTVPVEQTDTEDHKKQAEEDAQETL